MSSPKPKLYYFNVRGRGELVRLVFVASGTPFEDIRLSKEQWAEQKKNSPTGQMPYVDTGDKKEGLLAQSAAIARYYSKKAGLMGTNDWEYYQIERVLGQVEDLFQELIKIFMSPPEQKADADKAFKEEKGPRLLGGLVQFLKDNGGQFFAGKSLSLADLACITVVDNLAGQGEVLAKFPELTEHKKRVVAGNAKLAEYLKNRPETPM